MSNHGTNERSRWAMVVGGLAVLAGSVLWNGLATPRAAQAQIPDSGEQRNVMISELRSSNQKLDEVVKLLREIRDVQVAEKKSKDAKAPSKP